MKQFSLFNKRFGYLVVAVILGGGFPQIGGMTLLSILVIRFGFLLLALSYRVSYDQILADIVEVVGCDKSVFNT